MATTNQRTRGLAAKAPVHPPIRIEIEKAADVEARESLLHAAFGPARFKKVCHKLRVGRLPAHGLALVAKSGDELVGTLRLWHIDAGGIPALLLGPLAVAESHRSQGIGRKLIRTALTRAANLGHRAVLLVGDAPYYKRFGFSRHHTFDLRLPGPVDLDRFLGLELKTGALASARGRVRAAGSLDQAIAINEMAGVARRSARHRPVLELNHAA